MSLREFQVHAVAEAGRVRGAALIDFGASFVLAVLAFPFPFARAALPVPVFVASILASIVVVHVAYCAFTLRLIGRTPGMYLLDLGPRSRPVGWGRAWLWGLGASVAFWPTVAGAATAFDPRTGIPARMSGIETGSTKETT